MQDELNESSSQKKSKSKLVSPLKNETVNAQKKLDSKLKELEQEISKFKAEKQKVTSLQREYEQQLNRVTREIEDFESRKEQEVEEISNWKQQQLNEIQREKEEVMREKKTLLELRDAMMIEKSMAEQQIINETDRLLEKIQELEDVNRDLNRRVAEVYDKDLSSAFT